jgi:lysophospholipase L1-like esterase
LWSTGERKGALYLSSQFFRYRRFILLLIVGLLLSLRLAHVSGASIANAPGIPWSSPSLLALNNTGPVTLSGDERRYDCTPMTYRLIDDLSKTMHSGCFVPTAFGLLDPDQSIVIFNGTDEAEQIKFGGNPAALSVLPYSASVARFGGFPSVGTYMYLYTYFPSNLEEGRDLFLHRFKQITSTPNFTVTDQTGQPLPVNPFAMAYAPRGQWMVTETPGHSLVRVNLATFSILPFAPSFDIAGKPYASHQASMAITEDGRYAAVASNEFSSFKVYDLSTCALANDSDALLPQSCKSHDYWPYVKNQVAGTISNISQLQFVQDGLLSFQATTNTGTESYLLSPSGPITSLIPYLGIGDSFASGQGAFNYVPGTDSTVNQCHLSGHSYPLLLSGTLFSNHGHSIACSGATIHDVGSQSPDYSSQTSDQRSASSRQADGSETTLLHDFTPGYLSQQSFVTAYLPGVVTVQVGGNDAGFKDMLLNCVRPGSCYQGYEDRLEIEQTIDRTYNKWVQLYRQLQRSSPASRVYAIGYPHIVSSQARCSLNTPLTLEDIQFARDVTLYLNSAVQKAARAAGVQYIDITNALAGYELCSGSSGQPAVNGLTAGTDGYGILGQESFHPTAFGHDLLEQAILGATHNFTANPKSVAEPHEAAPQANDGDALLRAPKSGRSLRTVIPHTGMTTPSGTRGGRLTIKLKGSEVGLKPTATYTVNLGDTLVLGTTQSNAEGDVQVTLPIPVTAPTGSQPITVSGTGQNGTPVTVVTIIYVSNSPTDYDDDGLTNDQDSCPAVVNTGVDADHDGIDDACDPWITTVRPGGDTSPPTILPYMDASAGIQGDTLSLQPAAEASLSVQMAVNTLKKPLKTSHAISGSLGIQVGPPQRLATSHSRAQPYRPPLFRFLWFIWLLALFLAMSVAYFCRDFDAKKWSSV